MLHAGLIGFLRTTGALLMAVGMRKRRFLFALLCLRAMESNYGVKSTLIQTLSELSDREWLEKIQWALPKDDERTEV